MSDLVISDSEPEDGRAPSFGDVTRTSRSPRRIERQTAPSRLRTQADEVLVLSSASEDEEGIPSRFFPTNATSKRRRAATPQIEWSLSHLKGLEPLERADRGISPADAIASLSRDSVPRGVSKDSAASSSSFVSALDLLRKSSGSPRGSDSSDLEPLHFTKRAASSDAQDFVGHANSETKSTDSQTRARTRTRTRSRSRDSTVTRPPKRRSVSPTASSTDEGVPAPTEWAERFSLGATSLRRTESVEDSQKPPLVKPKPWDALEAKVASGKPKRATKKRVVKPKAERSPSPEMPPTFANDSDSSDIVISAVTRRKAGPSSSMVAPAGRRKSAATLDFLPPPIELPPDDRLRVLTSCALCSVAWPASKALATRQKHVRSCAVKLDYTAETVRYLVDKQVLELAEAAELERRATDDAKTLFDRAIGKGEGSHAMREVTVIGVESLEHASMAEWNQATTALQSELDALRRKEKVAKVIKIAKQIRQERSQVTANSASETATGADTDSALALEVDLPPSTGRLMPASTAAASLVADRVEAVLGLAAADESEDPFASPPRPTQPFESSRIARAQAVEPAMPTDDDTAGPTPAATGGRARSPFRELSLPDPRSGSISRQGHSTSFVLRNESSLWHLAAGRDDARLDSVVLKKPPHVTALVGSGHPESPSGGGGGRGALDDWDEDDLLVGGASEAGGGATALSNESSSSSEEEPLAAVVERKSPKRRRRRSPVQPDPETSIMELSPVAVGQASPALDDPPGMPDFASLAVTTLQRKVRQYGFRASKEKDVLVAQLRQVWIAMHSVEDDSTATASATVKSKSTGRTKAAARRKKKVDTHVETEDPEHAPGADAVPGETVGEKLRALIVANDQLYLRILRYEPVHIDEFATLAADNGVKVARPLLTRFLDEQSITHYSQDPTGGTRRRYR